MPPLAVLRRQRRDLNKSHEAKQRRMLVSLDRIKYKFEHEYEVYESKSDKLDADIKKAERERSLEVKKSFDAFQAEMDAKKYAWLKMDNVVAKKPVTRSDSQSSIDEEEA